MDDTITLIENIAGKLAERLANENIKSLRITGDMNEDDATALSNYIRLKENIHVQIEATGMQTIWNLTFAECESLITIRLPKVQSIGSAFYGCSSLTSADLPKATEVWNWAFSGCTSLASVNLPGAVVIGDEAFSNCHKLTSITMPQVRNIGRKAFYACTSLHTICLPATVNISNEAFFGCTALRKLVIAGTEKSTIGHSALSAVPALFLAKARYADKASLGLAWNHWGKENTRWWGRYEWPEIHSNYKGHGALDDPDNYDIHWSR